jgi:hypothetical protein
MSYSVGRLVHSTTVCIMDYAPDKDTFTLVNRHAVVADMFGTLVQLVLEGKPRMQIEEVVGFSTEVGLPVTLAAIGLSQLSQEMVEQIAAGATAPGATIHNEPFEVTPDLVADAILAADAVGRASQAATGKSS